MDDHSAGGVQDSTPSITALIRAALVSPLTPVSMADKVRTAFKTLFGTAPTHLGHGPGRVNLIGEHTDYNEGFVLPAAIDKGIYIAGRRRNDDLVGVFSLDYCAVTAYSSEQLQDRALPAWTLFMRGVQWILREMGHFVGGMDLVIAGDLPPAAGFSSSAAVEMAMLELTCALFDINMSQPQKAATGQRVENEFVGVPTGIMDQMISAVGQANHAILIDCRTYDLSPVPFPQGVSIVTLDTGVRRALVSSEYGVRRRQCEEAAQLLGIRSLRDITPEELDTTMMNRLPEVHGKRAQHVVYENARTLDAVEALKRNDLVEIGRLMNASHISLRDLYEVSIQELDIIADLAQQQAGCYGARMMGGGFGGAVIALVDDMAVAAVVEKVSAGYREQTGREAIPYVAKIGPGSSVKRLD